MRLSEFLFESLRLSEYFSRFHDALRNFFGVQKVQSVFSWVSQTQNLSLDYVKLYEFFSWDPESLRIFFLDQWDSQYPPTSSSPFVTQAPPLPLKKISFTATESLNLPIWENSKNIRGNNTKKKEQLRNPITWGRESNIRWRHIISHDVTRTWLRNLK